MSSYYINTKANPNNSGTITGYGTYQEGATCTLTASPSSSYKFSDWNISKRTKIDWDGDITGLDSVTYSGRTFYRVSNYVDDVENIPNDILYKTSDSYAIYTMLNKFDLPGTSEYIGTIFSSQAGGYLAIYSFSDTDVTIDGTVTHFKRGTYFYRNSSTEYVCQVYIENHLECEWDGDTTGLTPTPFPSVNLWYKISNKAYTVDSLPTKTLSRGLSNGLYIYSDCFQTFSKASFGTYMYEGYAEYKPYYMTKSIMIALQDDTFEYNGGTYTFTQGVYYSPFTSSGKVYDYPCAMYSRNIESSSNPLSITVDMPMRAQGNFTLLPYVTANTDGNGTTVGSGYYDVGDQVTLIATANSGYTFSNWKKPSTQTITWDGDTTGKYVIEGAFCKVTDLVPNDPNNLPDKCYICAYGEGEEPVETTGLASEELMENLYATGNDATYLIFYALEDVDFYGYLFNKGTYYFYYSDNFYVQSVDIPCGEEVVSTNSTYVFTMASSQNQTYKAYFNQNPHLITTVNPVGYGTVSGDGYYQEGTSVTLVATPNSNKEFVNWSVGGTTISTSNPLTYTMPSSDVTVQANFRDAPKHKLNIESSPSIASVYQSSYEAFSGTSITIKARPLTNYNFKEWSDGVTNANRTYVMPNYDVTLRAIYEHKKESSDIYQYRCYVKDQLSLTSKPKAFMVATTFTIRNDLLTKSNSTINVNEMPSNINNGDVLVVYSPKGYKLYQGVITKVENLTIQCSQMQHFYAGNWVYNVSPQTYLETEVYNLLSDYAQGKMNGSSYTDSLVASRLGGITLDKTNATQNSLPTKDAKSVMDMETFIYSLYQDYGIIFGFEINYTGTNTCMIKVPNYTSIKIGNNNNAISDLSPITTIEETNRLIIYGSTGTYRTTYVAKTDGSIVEAPSSTALRFNVTNTKIVFSDDEADVLVKANLPSQMYNHKVTFNLRVKNSLYDYKDFKLGMPLAIFVDGNYFNSVLTGWEISKAENNDLNIIKMTCGKVRTSLTDVIKLNKV